MAAAFPGLGIGFAGVALAFGLAVLTMAYAIGRISGCHLSRSTDLAGLGYHAWKNERGNLDLVGGGAWNRESFDPSPKKAFTRKSAEA